MNKPVVYIHTNDRYMLAAKVTAHSLRSATSNASAFDLRMLTLNDTPYLHRYFNKKYLWSEGAETTYLAHCATSFAPLRRLVPQLMNYEGRALVLDPDIFAVADVNELLNRDMKDKAIVCRKRVNNSKHGPVEINASSVMLLDCAKLRHWDWCKDIDAIFAGKIHFGAWLGLMDEPPENIGLLENEWNDLDTLNEQTKFCHTTELSTQPWKTGVRADFLQHVQPPKTVRDALRRIKYRVLGTETRVLPHPDPGQERLFFKYLKEALESGSITESEMRKAIKDGSLRKDAFELIAKLPQSAAVFKVGQPLSTS